MKRKAPELMGGVIWIDCGMDFVLYSESEAYTKKIKIAVDQIDA